ncbi:hypothetical protein [Stutzerimonas nitrititolerans]|uniref:hypothetical protein n=1 Tax=Stutzerimonas nitrititolerans TaxID=2482751 RepID=UPI0015E2E979|nr:hypothetical protein [Stutzerimonas nitrititolerans]MBA1185936.1 hypothetical protein [Stutzerimonas stutzeri]
MKRGLSIARSRGQAMAEFVVMTAGCLLLLFVLVPVVAKLSDMAYRAQEVARYTAWERTVWYSVAGNEETLPSQIDTQDGHLAMRSDSDILNSAEHRLMAFGQQPAAFTPHDIDLQSQPANRFWRWTHNSSGQAMAAPGSMPADSGLANARTPSFAYAVIDTYNDVMGVIAKVVSIFSFGRGDDDFLQIAHPTRNFYTTDIDIPVPLAGGALGSQPLFGERFPTQLNVGARSAVLADGWVAQSEGHFEEKANDFVLGSMIENNPIWGVVRSLLGFFEPSFKTVDFAPIDTEPMPDTEVDCNVATGFCYYKK